MSDPVPSAHKRLATLTGAGIAALLSPSGKILSSAAAASLVVAAVATQVVDDRARVTSLPQVPLNAAISPAPVSHVLIQNTADEEISVVLSEHIPGERKNTLVGMDSPFESGITQPSPGASPTRSGTAPLVLGGLPPIPGSDPMFSRPHPGTPAPSLLAPEVLEPLIVSDTPLEATPLEDDSTKEQKPADKGESPRIAEIGGDPEPAAPAAVNPPIILPSVYPPRIAFAPTPDSNGGDPANAAPFALGAIPAAAAVVSEPGGLGLLLAGLVGAVITARRRRSR